MWPYKKKIIPKKLHICMIAQKFPILGMAGAHSFLWPIAKKMVSLGHSVSVISWKNSQNKTYLDQDGVRAYFLGHIYEKASLSNFSELCHKQFLQLHKIQKFNIVHSIDKTGILIAQNKKLYKTPIIFDIEATAISQYLFLASLSQDNVRNFIKIHFNLLYRFIVNFLKQDRNILKQASAIFVSSTLQRSILERYFLFPDYHTYLVPYGVDVHDFSLQSKSPILQQKLLIPKQAKILLTISNMSELTGITSLLKAFSKVAIKKSSTRLIIIGNGPNYQNIQRLVLDLALGDHVILLGHIPNLELMDYIALSDIFISLTPHSSGFDPNLINAMVQKKIVIGADINPISSLIQNNINGFLTKPSDINTLGKHLIASVFDTQPSLELGEKAQSTVHKLFNLDTMAKQTLDAYYSVLKKRPL
ncbi:MAG: glycosyltransferase family 4 protein [Bdellovibrionales bacterium]|nr:glycosyltransferase family 4 protein [Bdellovibrionales bacterium]